MTPLNLSLNCGSMRQDAKTAGPTADAEAGKLPNRQIMMVGQQLDSRQIFLDGREVTIVHGQETYRLRLTAQNKLILTK
jgi:hemin uptake protein HemP